MLKGTRTGKLETSNTLLLFVQWYNDQCECVCGCVCVCCVLGGVGWRLGSVICSLRKLHGVNINILTKFKQLIEPPCTWNWKEMSHVVPAGNRSLEEQLQLDIAFVHICSGALICFATLSYLFSLLLCFQSLPHLQNLSSWCSLPRLLFLRHEHFHSFFITPSKYVFSFFRPFSNYYYYYYFGGLNSDVLNQ